MQECVAMQIVIITANLRLNYKQPETSNTACSLYFFSLPNQQGALTATTADGPEISPKAYILPWRSLQSSNPSHGPDHGAFSMSQPGEKIRSLDTHACCCPLEPKSQCFLDLDCTSCCKDQSFALLFSLLVKLPLSAAIVAGNQQNVVMASSRHQRSHMHTCIHIYVQCTMYMGVSSTIKDIW